jgi:hypothetical protein
MTLIRQVGELLAIEQTRSEATIAAMRAEMTGLFAALSSRIELLEEALGEAARRLRAIEGRLS